MTAHRILKDMLRAEFTVTDPGAGGTITVDRDRTVVPVVTATAEARTLANPPESGLLCLVMLKTDGGDCTLTVTNGYNIAGNTKVVLASAGEYALFVSVEIGANLRWRLVAQEESGIMAAGSGITAGSGTICEHSVTRIHGLIKTEILVDLTGLNSGGADGDIIGVNAAANCHIGQITAVVNGTIFAGRVSCLETPTGGEPDIDLYSATESTGTEDAAISGLAETVLLDAAADWTAAMAPKGLTANPAADKYLYLVASGGVTDATYTAGIFLIELWGR